LELFNRLQLLVNSQRSKFKFWLSYSSKSYIISPRLKMEVLNFPPHISHLPWCNSSLSNVRVWVYQLGSLLINRRLNNIRSHLIFEYLNGIYFLRPVINVNRFYFLAEFIFQVSFNYISLNFIDRTGSNWKEQMRMCSIGFAYLTEVKVRANSTFKSSKHHFILIAIATIDKMAHWLLSFLNSLFFFIFMKFFWHSLKIL